MFERKGIIVFIKTHLGKVPWYPENLAMMSVPVRFARY